MAEVVANSKVAVRAQQRLRPWRRSATAILLAAGILFPAARTVAQQNGPPTSGPNAAILFVPATLSPVSGFNPANGHVNGAGYGGDGSLANSSTSQFNYPVGMAYDTNGNLFIADESNYIVRRIDHATGDLSTFAGTPQTFGFSPSTGTGVATSAKFGLLAGLVVDSNNNVYVSDRSNNVVWKITSGGVVSVYAGGGTGGCSGAQTDSLGDGCPAIDATLSNPWALGIDANNNVYIADSYNDLVREVSSSTGKITTFAGVIADAGTYGDCNASPYSVSGSGPFLATQAHLCFPEGIAFDSSGNAYISNATGDSVQIVNTSGYISNFAGTRGTRSSTGNGGPATSATLNEPAGIYVDPANRVYISDFFGAEVRMVDSSGNINDVMGNSLASLNNYSIGEPDTEPVEISGEFSGAADGIYSVLMDPFGNIIASDSSAAVITSAGTTGQYYFGANNQIYETATSTSLNAASSYYPPYITISNPSNVTLNFTGSPTVTTLTPSATPAAFGIAGGTCTFPGSLAPGASCTVVVSFTPTEGGSPGTAYTGSIVIDSNSNSSPNTILLSGTGIGTCAYSASLSTPSSFSSPPNVTSATQAVTLTNTGVCPISSNLSSATFVNNSPTGSSAFTLVSSNCPATLNGGGTCTLNIAFTPTALTTYSARLELDIPSYGDIYSNLSGTGITAPAVSFNPTSLTFPSTADGVTTSTMSTVMTNVGNATLNNIVVSLAGSNPSYFAFSGTNNCGTSLMAGVSCTISVDFTPQAALTNYLANISVADNATGSPQTVTLSGAGYTPLPAVVINDSETITTTDMPAIAKGVSILDTETIHTTDTPVFTPSNLVLVTETVHTTDTPGITPSLLVLDAETVHTTDTPAITPSMLILDAETIHTTDTPVAKILTSPTTTVLTGSTATPASGNPFTLTATVSSTGGTPTGSVTFYNGSTVLGTVALSGGIATFTTSSLSDGSHSFTAVYLGTTLFLTSTSNTLVESVSDFTLSVLPEELTILPGGAGSLTVTITPQGGTYGAPITFAVSGLPAGATATFTPPSVTPGSTTATVNVTIQIPALTAGKNSQWRPGTAAGMVLGLLIPFLGIWRIRRTGASLRGLALIAFLALGVAAGLAGCSGGFFTQAPSTSTVTFTGTSGTTSHSATMQLTVQ